MKKLPVLTLVFLFCQCLAIIAAAQLQHKNGRLDTARAKEILRERIEEIRKEKIRVKKSKGRKPQQKTTAADQRITTSNTEEEAEVSLAVSPVDSNKLVLSFMEQSSFSPLEFPVYYSADGGKTWGQSSFSPLQKLMGAGYLPMGGGDPVFAWDKNGRVYMSWIYIGMRQSSFDTAFTFTLWAYSDNDGKNWQMEPGDKGIICKGAMDPSSGQMFDVYTGMADRQWLAVDNSGGPNQGTLYCSSFFVPGDQDFNKMGVSIFVKKFGDDHFDPGVLAYNGSTQFANVEVDKNGVVHAVFGDMFFDEIVHVSSNDGGQSYALSTTVATGTNLMGKQGIVHGRENAASSLAIDRDANLHVVWSDFTSTANAYYARSTDGGNSWSTPVNLNTQYNFPNALMATVAADNGVSIFFTGISSQDSANYYQVNSKDGSVLGSPALISSAPTYYPEYTSDDFFGDYNRTVRLNMTNFTAWTDGRNNLGPKVYFARTQTSPDAVREITAINEGVRLLSVYPNPASDVLSVDIEANQKRSVTIMLTDITGKQLITQALELNNGVQSIQLAIGRLPAGHFILTLASKGEIIATRAVSKS